MLTKSKSSLVEACEQRTLLLDASDEQAEQGFSPGSPQSGHAQGGTEFREKTFGFVVREKFQTAIGIAIVANTIVLGLEIDVPWVGWWRIEQIFVGVFLSELVLHLLHRGTVFFSESIWNMFDVFLVALGVLETWIVPWFTSQTHESPAMALRCLRLLRLLRLMRFVRMFDRLHKFAVAFMEMLPMLLWIFMVLFLLCYVNAIVLTHMLGKYEVLDEEQLSAEDREEIQQYFGDLVTTMFTLFRILTMDSWHSIANLVTPLLPISRLFFVFFIGFGSWTMISLLTAVVSDFLINATADLKELEAKRALDAKLKFCSYLRVAFAGADADGDRRLDREEFVAWASDTWTLKQLHKVGFDVDTTELVKLFDLLDSDRSYSLSVDEFVDGFARAQETFGMKHMLMLEHTVKQMGTKVSTHSDNINSIESFLRGPLVERLDNLSKQVEGVAQVQATLAGQIENLRASKGGKLAGLASPRT